MPASATPPELLELDPLELELLIVASPPAPESSPPPLELLELLLELLELELPPPPPLSSPLTAPPLELLELLEEPPAPPSYATPEPTCTMHPPLKPLKMVIARSACARIEIWQFNIEESPSRLHAHFARQATSSYATKRARQPLFRSWKGQRRCRAKPSVARKEPFD